MADLNIYPWQRSTWSQIQELRDRLPHAILFHGQAGIGKVDFVRHLAQSLLCEQPINVGHACGSCVSCRLFAERSHMDFRILRPEVLDIADGLNTEEGETSETLADQDISATAEKKSKKAPSKEIRIEQVRALAGFLNIGTHRGGRRIVVVYPLRAMNVFTANALLKMLEEPPPKTIFLLVSNGLDRVLPTILSRCRHLYMPVPERAQSSPWLQSQGLTTGAAETALAEQGGAPLAAYAQHTEIGDSAESREIRQRLFEFLSQPNQRDPLQLAEQMAKSDLGMIIGWLQRWVYDCLSYSSSQRIRYYPSHEKQIVALINAASLPNNPTASFWIYAKQLSIARRVADHPLNPKLFIENLLLGYIDSLKSTV